MSRQIRIKILIFVIFRIRNGEKFENLPIVINFYSELVDGEVLRMENLVKKIKFMKHYFYTFVKIIRAWWKFMKNEYVKNSFFFQEWSDDGSGVKFFQYAF